MVANLIALALLAALALTPISSAPTAGTPKDLVCTPLAAAIHRLGIPTPPCSTIPAPGDPQPVQPQGSHDNSTPWPKAPKAASGGHGDPFPWVGRQVPHKG